MLIKAIFRGAISLIIMTIISTLLKYQRIDPFQVRSTFLVGIMAALVAAASDYLKVFGIFSLFGILAWSVGYFVFGKLLSK